MLIKMSLKKIMVSSTALFILLLLYLIPSSNVKEINLKNDNIEYIYPDTLETIYLLDKDDFVSRTSIVTCKCDEVEKAKNLIEGLIIDGKKSDIIPNGFRSIIPPGTKVLDIKLENNTLIINFSSDFLEIDSKYEEKMIEALIYTLTGIEGINSINILVEGIPLDKLPNSNKPLNINLNKTFGINKIYNIATFNELEVYTVYYVNSYNDNYYYVPVTKYINNNTDDKIKLIIEQLAASPIYESNLMSFLNNNIKLINYQLEEDKITLNFNEMIFHDITTNNILEEVIYTICLSLENELNVKEVIFNVNDKKITTILLKGLD